MQTDPVGRHVEIAAGFRAPPTAGMLYPFDVEDGSEGVGQSPEIRSNPQAALPMVFSGVFSDAECDRILRAESELDMRHGLMMGARPSCRRSRIAWLPLNQEFEWIYEKAAEIFEAVNQWYRFRLTGMIDPIQFTAYDLGDAMGWHLDTGSSRAATRKISLSVQLTSGSDYAGGALEFCAVPETDDLRGRGTVVVFPSFLAHRVTEVTAGRRRCLVAWAHGPTFR